MKNQDVADIFERMGTLLEIKGEIVFKTRAYYKAAETIAGLPEDIETLRKENRLTGIPGIGQALAEKISQYLDTGRMQAYEELIKEVPEGLLDVVHVPSIGPKKAKLFFDQLKVKSVADLREAVDAGKLSGLPGIQEKTVENIRRGLKIVREGQERMNLGAATQVADEFVAALKKLPEVKEIAAAGSLRRGRETVRDIDILINSVNPQRVMDVFVRLPQVKSVNAHGETRSSVLTRNNVQVDIRVVEPKSFGAALLYFTGSKDFNIKLRQIAIKKEMKVSEYGVFSVKGGRERMLAGKTEAGCFKALGLPYVPPEMREDFGEEEYFARERFPALVELKDIQGDLHVHSTWSDGHNTIAQMAEAARAKGYKYLAVSDHSPRLRVAGGVSPEDLKKKKKEIDALNAKMKDFHILFGAEVEIDSDGNLDYNNAVLSEFDFLIAAIHSGFEQSSEQLTKRLVKVCQNKYVHTIAHPTGVHLGKRGPYHFDFSEVCKAAVDNNVCLEINAFPVRLDLNGANVYHARKHGVKFVIDTDAHRVEHMDYMKFGVTTARRGWLTKGDVLNTLSYPELTKAMKK
ncbi:MAG TPA: DNA polymerase/3'-5' exonuclease PolX [Candidatus Omnitrophica bacterium]|nr:DNA polymerase/3'-5' exonuclease PolX [Candidatus Omnitrophota bacterium]HCI45097.1 DNA polymerase/3'-5' exonuclease PolX [Candidatus Omnitrophota bacterium]